MTVGMIPNALGYFKIPGVVDDLRGSRPIPSLQAHLDPAGGQRSLGPDGALAARPTPSFGAVRTVARVESIQAQTAERKAIFQKPLKHGERRGWLRRALCVDRDRERRISKAPRIRGNTDGGDSDKAELSPEPS
jgi:hypothetical protein